MKRHALQVVSEEPSSFRWQLLAPTEEALKFEAHSHSECSFADYAAALNAGTLALAAADEQSYENEAADPVGEGGSGAVADVTPS